MIRINLLPAKKSRKVEKGQKVILLAVLVVGVAVGGMFLAQSAKNDEISEQKAVVKNLNEHRASLVEETKQFDEYTRLEADLLQRQSAIMALRDARQTPTWALDELSQILTKERRLKSGPTMTKEMQTRVESNPNAAFSGGWDPKDLWLTLIEEKDHAITLKGGAQSDKDLTQFAKRLQASVYFQDVIPVGGVMEIHPTLKIPYYTWTIKAKVLY